MIELGLSAPLSQKKIFDIPCNWKCKMADRFYQLTVYQRLVLIITDIFKTYPWSSPICLFSYQKKAEMSYKDPHNNISPYSQYDPRVTLIFVNYFCLY